jgi:hypothetical protein
LKPYHYKPYPNEKYFDALIKNQPFPIPRLEEMGFEKTDTEFPSRAVARDIIVNYEKTRDIPSLPGTTRLSLHLRFGTVSIRELTEIALKTSEKWLNELIWRDFYQMIIHHFPHSEKNAFKPIYDRIEWRDDKDAFEKWCAGKTGYPIVDAGMRELNETGFMHNRVRMVVASFLTKHLLLDWRLGERYFAKKLLDFELASNVGGWQWAAGSGCDAAPYFRVFNPTSQTEKFDPEKNKWFNHQYLQKQSDESLAEIFEKDVIQKLGKCDFSFVEMTKITSLIKERANFVSEFWDLADYFFVAPTAYDEKAAKNWNSATPEILQQLIAVLENIEDFTSLNIETIVKNWMTQNEIGMGKVMQPFRLSLVGALKGPHLFDIVELIGKEETIKRLEKAIATL